MPFQSYEQGQMLLLPPSLDELVPQGDLARVVNAFVDSLAPRVVEEPLASKRGRPSYHPRAMLKAILYAYAQRMYSCRVIAKAMRQNVCFMWLCAGARPDFNTVNRFRSDYLAECLDGVFAGLCELLLEKGYVKGEEYFVDGTKLEADTRKHACVWRKNTKRFKEAVRARCREILREADALNLEEDEAYGGRDLPERGEGAGLAPEEIARAARQVEEQAEDEALAPEGIAGAALQAEEQAEDAGLTSEDIERAARELEERAEGAAGEERGKLLRQGAQLSKEAQKMREYERQEQVLGERNSFCATDTDATMMRMKNGELRGGYNLQIGTENQFVLGWSLGQNANDAASFIDHMERREEVGLTTTPGCVVADAGYGSEENYTYLEKNEIGSYVKYRDWFREQKGKLRPYEKGSFRYDEQRDVYVCPQGKELAPDAETQEWVAKSGFVSTVKTYRCAQCADCPVRNACTTAQARTVQRIERFERQKAQARESLASPRGEELRKRRGWEVETPFGDMKHNMRYVRTRLRGLAKATADVGYVLMSWNLRKMWRLQEAA